MSKHVKFLKDFRNIKAGMVRGITDELYERLLETGHVEEEKKTTEIAVVIKEEIPDEEE